MAKSSTYWEKRIAQGTWNTYNSLEEKNRTLLEFYVDASKSVKEELYALAEKYSKDGALSLSEMHKQNRLTELNKKYEKIAKELGEQIQETSEKNMQDGFQEVYKNTAAGIDSIGVDFAMPNKKLMEKLLNEPWRGDSFSGRLWKNQKKLAVGLNDILLTGLQQGKTTTEIAVNLHNLMGNSFNECHRLVRTETMHYLNHATLQRYKDTDVQYVRIWAAVDERTCNICGVGGYHDKVYPIEKAPILPFHPNCRCTYLPAAEEEYKAQMKQDEKVTKYEKKHVDRKEKHNGSNSKVERKALKTMEQIVEIAKEYSDEILKDYSVIEYGNGNLISNFINKKLGYDKLPQVVSENKFEKLKVGKQVLYRGLTENAGMSAGEMVNAFKYGKLYAGKGIYGNGTYTDTDKRVAGYYAYDVGVGSGQIMEMLLSDDARTVDFMEVYKEFEQTGIPKMGRKPTEAYQDIIENVGNYASIKGYDAIFLNGFQNKNHVVILNRGKVIIKE